MAVEVVEECKRWSEFPGEFDDRRMTFVMQFHHSGRNEDVSFGILDEDDGSFEDELNVRASVFARAVRRMRLDADVQLDSGSFRLITMTGRVQYTTACRQEYFFDLEDLLTLADIVDDTAVLS